jgi:DNA-binding beta-propeller fold protein YncE
MGGTTMRILQLCGAMLVIVIAASCGGNNTKAGVTITFPVTNPVTVAAGGTQQFAANVSGISTTTNYWQVCLPSATVTVEPTNCTPVPGATISGQTALTGYGTITQNGLYSAPAVIPQPNSFVVMAISTADVTAFAVASVSISSSVQVQILPITASLQTGEHFQFTATVTGATNTDVTWSVSGNPGGDATDGYVCPNPAAPQPCTAGEYFAPSTSPGAISVTATSVQNTAATASASVTVTAGVSPTFTSMDPITVAEGSVQQDIYITGKDFFNTTSVTVNGATLPSTSFLFINSTLIRATIPGSYLQQVGTVAVGLIEQNGGVVTSLAGNLNVVPIRPALVAVIPDTVSEGTGSASVSLTGGYYVPGRTVTEFDGSSAGITTQYVDSRHLNVTTPANSVFVAGLHQLVLQNSDAAAASIPSLTAKNVAVTPNPNSISTAPDAPIAVGASPSAVAIDYATGTALVANTGSSTVSVVNLVPSPSNVGTISVGNSPTGIAVDDLLSPAIALVVNNADQTVSTINLATMSVIGSPLSVSLTTATPVPLPYSIGINPLTHRAIVTYQNTSLATILDLSSGTPVIVQQFTGTVNSPYGTGNNPSVAVDPRLNWAVVTPGSSGVGDINIVDLGRTAVAGVDAGRTPRMVAAAQLSTSTSNTTLGVGLDTETHQILFTDPNAATLTSFNLLNQTVNSISFNNNGVLINGQGYVASAVNPFVNLGIAVNSDSGTAAVADLENGNVLQTVQGLGSNPIAVAVDPASNQAVIVNQGDGTVSVVSLGTIRTPQILETSPSTTLTSASPLTLTITGSGFTSGSVVRLDQVPVATATVAGSCVGGVCRQLTATVPASMLGSARRFMVDVLNSDSSVSNVTDLTVIQQVIVGTQPVGVAVDTERHLAVVTNTFDGTANMVALSPQTPVFGGGTAGAVGTIGLPILVGTNPQGVGVLPRLGFATVANNQSDNVTIVDVAGDLAPSTIFLCSGCVPVGVTMDGDTGQAAVTYSQDVGNVNQGNVTMVNLAAATIGAPFRVDQSPTGIAIDPTLGYAGVAASQTDALNILDITTGGLVGQGLISGFQEPAGVVFDALNQVFLVANSLESTVAIINPSTFQTSSVAVGVNPTSVDYDFQTSTLMTVNSLSNTISMLDYDCPPTNVPNGCSNPVVRTAVTGGSSTGIIGPNTIAIDPLLDIAVIVDPDNNRILLMPIPH